MSDKTVRVKPLPGLIVRDPSTFATMPEGGFDVVLRGRSGKYWRRRINEGTLIIVKDEKPLYQEVEEMNDILDDKKSKNKKEDKYL